MVEESLGVYIDDGELDPEETLAQLQARIDAAPPTRLRRRASSAGR